MEFDYSQIRPAGLPLATFGGTSSGYGPLKQMHQNLRDIFQRKVQSSERNMTSRDITDIMNIIGKCVIAGNIRRVAEIALGEWDDQEFIDLQNY